MTFEQVQVALATEQHQRALDLLNDALATDPNNPALLHARGAAYALSASLWPSWQSATEKNRNHALTAALADFNRALTLCPGAAEALLNRGLTHLALSDAKAANADLSEALSLGLEPGLAIQAHNARSGARHVSDDAGAAADLDVVNLMRGQHAGNAWRSEGPQLVTLRTTLQVSVPKEPVALPAKKKKKKKAPQGAPDWATIDKKANAAYQESLRLASKGTPGALSPNQARHEEWLQGFAEPLRPAVALLLAGTGNWEEAKRLAGRGHGIELAKALVGRKHAPFIATRHYLLGAAKALQGDAEGLAHVAEDFLRELKRLENFRSGQEEVLAQVKQLCPSNVLSKEARTLIKQLAGSRKLEPLSAALLDWAAEPE